MSVKRTLFRLFVILLETIKKMYIFTDRKELAKAIFKYQRVTGLKWYKKESVPKQLS